MTGHPEEAISRFQKTLATSKEPRLLAWSHIYLGRMLDLDCKRDQALSEYKLALEERDGQQDTRLAAERGVKAAYAVKGHSCEEDDDDDHDAPPGSAPAPAKPRAQSPSKARGARNRSRRVFNPVLTRVRGSGVTRRMWRPYLVQPRERRNFRPHGALGSSSERTGNGTGAWLCPSGVAAARADPPLAGQRTESSRATEDDPEPPATTSGWSFWATPCSDWWWPRPCFCLHPEWQEGELTRVRAQLVSRQHMAEVAAIAGTGASPAAEPGRGPQRPAAQEHRAFEYHGSRDWGAVSRRRPGAGADFVRRQVMGEAAEQLAASCAPARRWATTSRRCRNVCRRSRAGTPVYRVKSESGPDHRKRFLVEVRLKAAGGEPGKPLARGMGSTKKHAEQDAARRALARLRQERRMKTKPGKTIQ